jgi:hypothetical protein
MRDWRQNSIWSCGILAAACVLASCGGGNYYTEVTKRQSDYVEVKCSPAGNRGGFDVQFPPCACNHGISISWIGRGPRDQSSWSGIVVHRGYLSDIVPEVVVASRDGTEVEKVMVRNDDLTWNELDPQADGDEWRRNEQLFGKIMEEFGPRLYEFDMYCRAMETMKRGASSRASF